MSDIINIINLGPHQEARSMNPRMTPAIILRSREQRVLSVCQQSKEQGFACRFWEGVIDSRGGWAGINLSFRKIVEWAKENNLSHVIIGEDDLQFSAPFAWQYYLGQMPDDFDIYSGGIYSGTVKEGRIINGWSGNTLITVHHNFYDEFLKISAEALVEADHFDRRLGRYAYKNNYRIIDKYVCYQMQGYSDNHRRETKHTAFLEEMNLFTGLV